MTTNFKWKKREKEWVKLILLRKEDKQRRLMWRKNQSKKQPPYKLTSNIEISINVIKVLEATILDSMVELTRKEL